MTFEELKALLREWYEAGKPVNLGSMAGVDAWMDVNYRLKECARTLYEGGEVVPTAEGREMADKLYKNRIRREHGRR